MNSTEPRRVHRGNHVISAEVRSSYGDSQLSGTVSFASVAPAKRPLGGQPRMQDTHDHGPGVLSVRLQFDAFCCAPMRWAGWRSPCLNSTIRHDAFRCTDQRRLRVSCSWGAARKRKELRGRSDGCRPRNQPFQSVARLRADRQTRENPQTFIVVRMLACRMSSCCTFMAHRFRPTTNDTNDEKCAIRFPDRARLVLQPRAGEPVGYVPGNTAFRFSGCRIPRVAIASKRRLLSPFQQNVRRIGMERHIIARVLSFYLVHPRFDRTPLDQQCPFFEVEVTPFRI